MIKVEEAQEIILKKVGPLGSEEVAILESLGRTLAEDIYSKDDIPPFENSAMDGYAVSSSDVVGASQEKPALLDVLEDLPAGSVARQEVRKGKAIRIMTGAPLPSGADAVVIVERTETDGRRVKIFTGAKSGDNVRRLGEDIKKGERVLRKGTVIRPAEMGILASIGVESIRVVRLPRIGILATGDELVEIEEDLTPGKIRNSNTYSLLGQVENSGAIANSLGIARDNKAEIRRKIEQGLENDILLISGGVSVGDYDYVKDVMVNLDASIEFWKVAMRPGKPLAFGLVKGKPVFGLPGNPVSSMISFELFVRPMVLKMLGRDIDDLKEVGAVLEEDIEKRRGLRYFLRAQTKWEDGVYRTSTTGPQGSGILKSMALANSLIILPEEEENIRKGTKVTVRFLR